MNRLTPMKRAAASGAVAVLLLTGGAVPALAASPGKTVSECTADKVLAKTKARLAFKGAKVTAWSAYATAVESSDAKGTRKSAAQERRKAVKAALVVRKASFVKARTDFRGCMATASDAPASDST